MRVGNERLCHHPAPSIGNESEESGKPTLPKFSSFFSVVGRLIGRLQRNAFFRRSTAHGIFCSSEVQANYTRWRVLLRLLSQLLDFRRGPRLTGITSVLWHRRAPSAPVGLGDNVKAPLDADGQSRFAAHASEEAILCFLDAPASTSTGLRGSQRRGSPRRWYFK